MKFFIISLFCLGAMALEVQDKASEEAIPPVTGYTWTLPKTSQGFFPGAPRNLQTVQGGAPKKMHHKKEEASEKLDLKASEKTDLKENTPAVTEKDEMEKADKVPAGELKDDMEDVEANMTSQMRHEANMRSEFLRNEIRTLVAAKAKNRKLNVLSTADQQAKTATQKFRLFRSKDAETGHHGGQWKISCSVRGLALGGWFVPEKFINVHNFPTPDMPASFRQQKVADTTGTIYEGTDAPDMCRLSREIGREELDARFKHHLNTFITEKDFEFIAKTGVNTLRIPIGYWNVVEDPYKIYAPINPANSLALMEKALDWAKKYDLSVILDLHSSPGSQNGWEHSGCSEHGSGMFDGANATKNRQLSIEVCENLAKRFGQHPALLGIEVINEPTHYSEFQLMDLYRDSYEAIRKHAPDVWVIVYAHKLSKVQSLARSGEKFHNLVLDKHEYACFGDGRTGPPGQTYQHHRRVTKSWQHEVAAMNNVWPTMLGEWSLCHGGGVNMKLQDWNLMQQTTWLSSTIGSVFWTYKTLTDNARWSYRVALDDVDVWGELPSCAGEPDHKKKSWMPSLAAKKHEEALEDGEHEHHTDIGYEWEATLPVAATTEKEKSKEDALWPFREEVPEANDKPAPSLNVRV